jgi:hypothetical protein
MSQLTTIAVVLKTNQIDTARTNLSQLSVDFASFIVDGRIEANLLHQPAAFLRSAGAGRSIAKMDTTGRRRQRREARIEIAS